MKKKILVLIFSYALANAFGQTSENKSGIQQFNISKKNTLIKKSEAEQRALADVTPPVIKILTPDLKKDTLPKTESKMLTV